MNSHSKTLVNNISSSAACVKVSLTLVLSGFIGTPKEKNGSKGFPMILERSLENQWKIAATVFREVIERLWFYPTSEDGSAYSAYKTED